MPMNQSRTDDSREHANDDGNDPLDEENDCRRKQTAVRTVTLVDQLRDSRSQVLTIPIDPIFKIPDAKRPPNAPAKGEQTMYMKPSIQFVYLYLPSLHTHRDTWRA
jgi:hypothetical protein